MDSEIWLHLEFSYKTKSSYHSITEYFLFVRCEFSIKWSPISVQARCLNTTNHSQPSYIKLGDKVWKGGMMTDHSENKNKNEGVLRQKI